MKLGSMHLWILAFFTVAAAAVYQRMTGPTYPVRGHVNISGLAVSFKLPTSSDASGDAEVRLKVADSRITGSVDQCRYPSNDAWSRTELERQGDELVGRIAHQPPAGKMMYRIQLQNGAESVWLTAKPVIMRFKGVVPDYVLLPHILLMFLAMWFSMRTGFEAIAKGPQVAKLALWTVISFTAGGIILGPLVQKLAFGAYWTGWPIGKDLTDNKTMVAWLAWVLAAWRLRKRADATGWALAASVILFLVYMIPHSVLGSEIDYSKAQAPSM
jgi:hypothetical protein